MKFLVRDSERPLSLAGRCKQALKWEGHGEYILIEVTDWNDLRKVLDSWEYNFVLDVPEGDGEYPIIAEHYNGWCDGL